MVDEVGFLDVGVLPHQRSFINSNAPSTGLVAGFGAGKSYSGTLKTIIKKMMYPTIKVAYYLPTYGHIRDIAFVKFCDMCNELGLSYQLNRSDKELHIQGYGTIIFRNLSDPDSIIGYSVGYSLIDECDVLPKAKMDRAFKQILARNREILPDGKPNQVDVVGTPEGFRWFYSRFVENANDSYKLIRAKTTDNPYLPDDYVDTLREAYDPVLLSQYIEGEFVNVNGSAVYHQFDRDVHVVPNMEFNKSLPLIITFDFNINPYNSILLLQVIDGVVHVIDNAIIKNKPLVDSLSYLKQKFDYLGAYLYSATIYGDASGNSRSQGTAVTNYDFIKDAGFHKVKIKRANPRVQDRVNIVNSMLRNAKGDVKLKITECNQELINDMEQMSYDEKGIVDKSNQDISHTSDSLGYYCDMEHRLITRKELSMKVAL